MELLFCSKICSKILQPAKIIKVSATILCAEKLNFVDVSSDHYTYCLHKSFKSNVTTISAMCCLTIATVYST